jgi:hypothetical protein
MTSLVAPAVREAVKGSGPLTAVITGPVSSLGAAVVNVPVQTWRGFLVGAKDAIDTSPAKSGIMEGAPRCLQNVAAFAGHAAFNTAIAAGIGWLFNVDTQPLLLGPMLAAYETSPGAQALDGLVEGAKVSIVKGYTFAKQKLGNY